MRRLWPRLCLLALLLCGTAQAEVAVPPLKQRVTDLTGTLDASQQQALEARLAALESSKGAQIAVLLLPSTRPETIEQFGIRVAEAWKLGRKGVDDGVLLLIAKDDRKSRIEVGYGLEGALNDATAKRIVAETITPYFKRGEFYPGIDAGVAAIIKVVEGEPLAPVSKTDPSATAPGSDSDLAGLVAAAFFLLVFGNQFLQSFIGKIPAGLVIGGVIAALAWLLLGWLSLAAISGLVAFLVSLLLNSSGWHRGSGYSGPSGWGSGGGWSSSGGGDFGGGGGSFGGGGASGDW